MEFTTVITERTTAASDAVLAVLGVGCALSLWRTGRSNRWRSLVWSAAFGLVSAASALGAVVHAFDWSSAAHTLFWQPLYLILGLSIALFVVGVADELWGRRAARRMLSVMIAAAVGFYALTLLVPRCFLLFSLFELSAMTFAAAGYGWLTLRARRADFALVASGMGVSILAAIVQTRHSLLLTIIWEFDHNGLFHLVQMAGLLLLTAGLCGSFRADAAKASASTR